VPEEAIVFGIVQRAMPPNERPHLTPRGGAYEELRETHDGSVACASGFTQPSCVFGKSRVRRLLFELAFEVFTGASRSHLGMYTDGIQRVHSVQFTEAIQNEPISADVW
jgi:hypothetical protein